MGLGIMIMAAQQTFFTNTKGSTRHTALDKICIADFTFTRLEFFLGSMGSFTLFLNVWPIY